MVRYALFSVVALLVSAGSSAYAAELMTADQQAIAKIEKGWGQASKNRDRDFFMKNLSDDFTYIQETGQLWKGPAAYVDGLMKAPKIADFTDSDQLIRVHGSTGVVTGRWTYRTSDGVEASTLYTDVYAKGPDGWKAVASQETTAK
jgi:ketosteroid isomerase-like protein